MAEAIATPFVCTVSAQELEMRVTGRSRLTGVDESTMWPKEFRTAIRGMRDLALLAKSSATVPAKIPAKILRRMDIYTVAVNNLRNLVEQYFMIRLGKDTGYQFALERGVEDMIINEMQNLVEDTSLRCRVRFAKSVGMPDTEMPFFGRIVFRFDQFEVTILDRSFLGEY
jgi:hypothetical protein